MQKTKLTAEEYQMLKSLEEHITTARVGYVRGFMAEEQKILKKVHNAHFDTYLQTNANLCGDCVVRMFKDLIPMYDSYQPEPVEAPKAKKTKKNAK